MHIYIYIYMYTSRRAFLGDPRGSWRRIDRRDVNVRVKHYQTSFSRPPFLGTPLVPSRACIAKLRGGEDTVD